MPQFATNLINAYGLGEQQRLESDRRSAISRYSPGALQGNQGDINALSAADPQLALGYANRATQLKDQDRERFIQNADWVGSVLVRPDGSPVQTPEELNQIKTLAKARGFSADQIDQLTPEHVPGLIQASQAARQAQRQAAQDKLQGRVAEANIRQSDASAAASRATVAAKSGPGGLSNQQIDNEAKIRTEFTNQSKDFVNVRDAFGRIQASAQDPSAAGDLALIFNYMKVLDPGSTVREGEFATAQNATGVPGQIMSMYNKVVSGERLNTGQRADFVGRAGKLYDRQLDSFKKTAKTYQDISQKYGFDSSRTVPDLSLGITSSAPVPDWAK